jgi:hypothetical protein
MLLAPGFISEDMDNKTVVVEDGQHPKKNDRQIKGRDSTGGTCMGLNFLINVIKLKKIRKCIKVY